MWSKTSALASSDVRQTLRAVRRRAGDHGHGRASRSGTWPQRPLQKLQFERLLSNQALERCNPRLTLPQQVGRAGIFVEGSGLMLPNPEPDQVAGDFVPSRKTVQCLASQEFLRDLALELHAVGSMSCHAFML